MHQAPPPPDRSKWQCHLNEHWPQVDRDGAQHARDIPDQPAPIPVRVRVVWERDGEEWIDGMARRWRRDSSTSPRTRAAVYVAFPDERNQVGGIWVAPADVERR